MCISPPCGGPAAATISARGQRNLPRHIPDFGGGDFSIQDQICPTLGYFQRTRNARIRVRTYSEITIPSGKIQTPTPQASEPAIILLLWLVESALISFICTG